MATLNKNYILRTLSEEKLWKAGESDTFVFENWKITLRREEEMYKPFMYSLSCEKINTNESFGRRYTTMEKAFLHIFNDFNENVNIKNKYETLSDALTVM